MNEPVGHTPPFTGSPEIMWHCATEVLTHAKAGHFKCKELHTHAAQLYGEAAMYLPSDGPDPVFALGDADGLPLTVEDCIAAIETELPELDVCRNTDAEGYAGIGNWWLIAQLVFQLLLIGKEN